ncbi:hypothetical protein [Pseudomonas chlororaphis]|uniref:hypothetical protein n=1 Tax=Pseudomonas chlororaphis TaxID=587753 RepID=UPI000A422568|nr:hypothetical protein [Pseudomonas chlororaphis]
MNQAHHPGLLFDPAPCTGHARAVGQGSTQLSTSEESGHARAQDCDATRPALLRKQVCIDAQKTKSLCCAAAGIIDPISATAEARIPQEKLREAASADATLIAQERPPAQPVVGYMHPDSNSESPSQAAIDEIQFDERIKFEKEFPVPEGLQYCAQRGTYIAAPDAKTSDSFAREHYAYQAGFAAWERRAWKHAALVGQQAISNVSIWVRPLAIALSTSTQEVQQ